MSIHEFQLDQASLTGDTVELQPLQAAHAQALLAAAADGQLWQMKLTVIPGPETIAEYVAVALA